MNLIQVMRNFSQNTTKSHFRQLNKKSIKKNKVKLLIKQDGSYEFNEFVDDPTSKNNFPSLIEVPSYNFLKRRNAVFHNLFYEKLACMMPNLFKKSEKLSKIQQERVENFNEFSIQMIESVRKTQTFTDLENKKSPLINKINQVLSFYQNLVDNFKSPSDNFLKLKSKFDFLEPETFVLFFIEDQYGKEQYVLDIPKMKELYSEWYEIFFENFRNGISGIKKLINKTKNPFYEWMLEDSGIKLFSEKEALDLGSETIGSIFSLPFEKKFFNKYEINRTLEIENGNEILTRFNQKIDELAEEGSYISFKGSGCIDKEFIFIENKGDNVLSEDKIQFVNSLKNLDFNLNLNFDFYVLHILATKNRRGAYHVIDYQDNTQESFKKRYERLHFYYDKMFLPNKRSNFSISDVSKNLSMGDTQGDLFRKDFYKFIVLGKSLPTKYKHHVLKCAISNTIKSKDLKETNNEWRPLLQLFFEILPETSDENGEKMTRKTIPFKLGQTFAIISSVKDYDDQNKLISSTLQSFLSSPRSTFGRLCQKLVHWEPNYFPTRIIEISQILELGVEGEDLFQSVKIPILFDDQQKADFMIGLFHEMTKIKLRMDQKKQEKSQKDEERKEAEERKEFEEVEKIEEVLDILSE